MSLEGVVTPRPWQCEARCQGPMPVVMVLYHVCVPRAAARPSQEGLPSGLQMESVDSLPAQQVPGGVQR